GFALIFSPHTLHANIHLGVAPTWSSFALAIPIAMIAYTGIETVSNLAEEARDPRRAIPRSISWVAIAVFAIYFTLPWIALSALPGHKDASGHYVTKLGLPPAKGGFQNDPVLGLVENLGLHGTVLSVAMLSFTIAHVSVIALRLKSKPEEAPFRAKPSLQIGGRDIAVFAVLGGLGTALAWLSVVIQTPSARYAGLGWLALGFATYYVY